MKPISLHPISILVGLALAGLVAISTGAAQSVQPIPTKTILVGEIPASWWTFVQVTADQSGVPVQTYTVPADRHFVVTRLLRNGGLRVDGHPLLALDGVENSIAGNGTRVVLSPGSIIEVFGASSGTGSLWGYLEPVR